MSGKNWEALGPRTAASAQHCHKNSPSGEGRYFLWLRFPSQLRLALTLTAHRIAPWLGRALLGASAVTKGGNEYAVLVIILYASQFVFQYVISIIKLPKRVTNDTGLMSGS